MHDTCHPIPTSTPKPPSAAKNSNTNAHTAHVITTPSTSITTCTVVPAFAGSCPSLANRNGSKDPHSVDVVTIANRLAEIPIAAVTAGSGAVLPTFVFSVTCATSDATSEKTPLDKMTLKNPPVANTAPNTKPTRSCRKAV